MPNYSRTQLNGLAAEMMAEKALLMAKEGMTDDKIRMITNLTEHIVDKVLRAATYFGQTSTVYDYRDELERYGHYIKMDDIIGYLKMRFPDSKISHKRGHITVDWS